MALSRPASSGSPSPAGPRSKIPLRTGWCCFSPLVARQFQCSISSPRLSGTGRLTNAHHSGHLIPPVTCSQIWPLAARFLLMPLLASNSAAVSVQSGPNRATCPADRHEHRTVDSPMSPPLPGWAPCQGLNRLASHRRPAGGPARQRGRRPPEENPTEKRSIASYSQPRSYGSGYWPVIALLATVENAEGIAFESRHTRTNLLISSVAASQSG